MGFANLVGAVYTTLDQTIGGIKTFLLSPIVPAPTASGHAIPMGAILEKTGVGMGYGDGSGGVVTQLTSKSTNVTLNKPTGKITMHNASLTSGGSVAFDLINTAIGANDVIFAQGFYDGSGVDPYSYRIEVRRVRNQRCTIVVTNISGGSLSEALIINFSVIKGAIS